MLSLQLIHVCALKTTVVLFMLYIYNKIEFLNVVKCWWSSQGAVGSEKASCQSNAKGSGGKVFAFFSSGGQINRLK